jgi:pimeloyl-[acyl-carrier protein] methyl ester esterase
MTGPSPPGPDLTDIGAGRPLVFLHGWSVDRSFFAGQAALAKEGFRVLVPDLPGHGDRPLGSTPATMAGLADALGDLLDQAALDGAVLVGWSMGATVALDHLARRGTGHIAGLVIVDMSPKVANAPDWPHGLAGGQDLEAALQAADRMERDWPLYAPRIARAMFAAGEEASPRVAGATAGIAARDPAVMAALWRSLVRADHRGTVAALAVPVLAVAGADSRLYSPAVARWLAATAPEGRSVTIAAAGHAPHVENPAAFNDAVARFARGL